MRTHPTHCRRSSSSRWLAPFVALLSCVLVGCAAAPRTEGPHGHEVAPEQAYCAAAEAAWSAGELRQARWLFRYAILSTPDAAVRTRIGRRCAALCDDAQRSGRSAVASKSATAADARPGEGTAGDLQFIASTQVAPTGW